MKKLTRVYDVERSLKNLKRIKKYFINFEIRVTSLQNSFKNSRDFVKENECYLF
jgi:hypothetical protein